MSECRGCGDAIEFVEIELKRGRDMRAQDAPPAEVAVAEQHEAAKILASDRLRRAQETVDIEWEQATLVDLGDDLGGELE